MEFTVRSDSFKDGDYLTKDHILSADYGFGCEGGNKSPHLAWSGAPTGTKSFAVTCFDPDAPTGSGFWHWAVYNIPASVTSLAADAGNPDAGLLPPGAVTLPNEARMDRFVGAAPPPGHGEHRYYFTVTALDVPTLELDPGSTPAVLGFNLLGHIVGRAQLTGVTETP